MARLWKTIDGEPFLINPHLAIVGNPKKGRSNRMAKRKVSRSRGRKATSRRRARTTRITSSYSKNPFTVPGVVIGNPRRRRKSGFALNRRRKGKKRYRRNPAVFGLQLPALQTVAYVGIGFVGTPVLEGFLSSFMPTTFATSTLGKYVIRIGSLLGLSWAGRAVMGKTQGNMIAIGGGVYLVTSLIKDFMPGVIPGLSQYVPGIAAYQTRLSAYQTRLSAYDKRMLGQMPRGLAAPDFGARNTANSAGDGGMNIVAQRFRRFQ